MNRLEEQLRKALRSVEPPAAFAERVLARAKQDARAKHAPRRGWSWLAGMGGLRWAAVCALCLAIAGGGLVYQRARLRRGEEAKNQLMLAMRITSSKLRAAQDMVRDMNSGDKENQ